VRTKKYLGGYYETKTNRQGFVIEEIIPEEIIPEEIISEERNNL